MFACCGEATTTMAESPQLIVTHVETLFPTPSAWMSKRPPQKMWPINGKMREEYWVYFKRNELFTILEALNAITTRTISLLMICENL